MLSEVKSLPTGEAGASGGENSNKPMETAEGQSPNSQEPRQSGGQVKPKSKLVLWLIGLIILGAVGYGGWYLRKLQNPNNKIQINPNNQNSNIQTPLTQPKTEPNTDLTIIPQTPATQEPTAITKVDPTADWKTYENKDYGFSFKYPGDWTVRSDSISKTTKPFISLDGREIPFDLSLIPSQNVTGYDELEISLNPTDQSLDSLVGSNDQFIKNDNKTIKDIVWALGKSETSPKDTYIAWSVINNIYSNITKKYIGIHVTGNQLIDKKETIDQILSTFRFTK